MKSTSDDLISAYRLTGKLSRKHKEKLIALLTEDVHGPSTIQVTYAHEPKKRSKKAQAIEKVEEQTA